MNKAEYILYDELSIHHKVLLLQIKRRIGRTYYPKGSLLLVKELIQLGLVAGDYSKLYVTDKGDDFLEKE